MTEQMTLGELIEALKRKDPDRTVSFDFVYFRPTGIHSYRGYYDQLALGYTADGEITVKALLEMLRDANGKTFEGYKGGNYVMGPDTRMWVANHNESGSTAIVDVIDQSWRVLLVT